MLTANDAETTEAAAPPTQGDLSTLDERTAEEAAALRRQMRGSNGPQDAAPIIWGSIRIFSVYGKWSFWRKPKPRPPKP
jgi:hypothetical protein